MHIRTPHHSQMRNTKEHIFQPFLIPPALREKKEGLGRERERRKKQEKEKKEGRREKNQVLPWILNLDQDYTTNLHFKNTTSPLLSQISQRSEHRLLKDFQNYWFYILNQRESYITWCRAPSYSTSSFHQNLVLPSQAGNLGRGTVVSSSWKDEGWSAFSLRGLFSVVKPHGTGETEAGLLSPLN